MPIFPGIGSTTGSLFSGNGQLAGDILSGLFAPLPTLFNIYQRENWEEIDENGLFPTIGKDLAPGIDAGLDYLFGPDFPSLDDPLNSAGPNSANPGSIPMPTLQQPTFDYLNAELAKLYGMDRNTAYQEALSNTAYQRAVKDMQSAGLNPASIFGAGRGSGAGGVAFIGNSNSASGFGSSSNSKLFESDTYGMIASLAGLATAIVTKKPQNFWLGQQSAQGIMQTLNVLDRKFSK